MKLDTRKLNALRKRAREMLSATPSGHLSDQQLELNVDQLIDELHTYEVELQLQNQELFHSQNQFKQALSKYEALFHTLPLPALVTDTSGVIVEANAEAAALFGFRNHRLLHNHSIYRLIVSEDRMMLSDCLRHQSQHENLQVDHLRVVSQQNCEHEVELHITRLPNSYHIDSHTLITLIDRSEDYRRERESVLMHTIMDNSDAQITAFDRMGRCIYANKKAAKAIGSDERNIVGNTRHMWMSDEETLAAQKQDTRVFNTEESLINEEKLRTSDTTSRYFLTHRFPIYTDRGDINGVATIATEVTQRKEDSARLQLAMAAFSKGHEAIMITDEENRIISVNAAFENITGYSEAEVLGKTPNLLSSGRHDANFYRNMWASIREKGYWEGEIWNKDKHGRVFPEWLSASRVPGGHHKTTNYIGVFSDITKRKLIEQEIEHLAFYDTLTGIPNRYLLSDRVEQAIHRANRDSSSFALAFYDLDHFKQINDVHGHDVGDEILKAAVSRVSKIIRENDTLSRLGGDEFVLILEDIKDNALNERLAEIVHTLSVPYDINNTKLESSASIGVAIYPQDGSDLNSLLKNADTAMYKAKEEGRGMFRYFGGEMAREAKQKLEILNELRDAVRSKSFNLAYQPQVSLHDENLVGMEALIRWQRKNGDFASPAHFIPLAEKSGFINEIGQWVIQEAFTMAASLKDAGHCVTTAVNVSAVQFASEGFLDVLQSALDDTGLKANCIELEITENVAMNDPSQTISVMKKLKQMGFHLSIDDFGTGYSSLAYLHWMPVDKIKIDRTFIRQLGQSPSDETICRSIINLAQSLDIFTIAEGVENQRQYDILKSAGCDFIQGYLVSPPLGGASLKDWLND